MDDGSTDTTAEVVNNIKDKRIRLLQLNHNMGIACARNAGLKLANGDYYAVQDSDDISLPNRFEKQVHFLENNPNIMACGTQAVFFNDKEKWPCYCLPIKSYDIKGELLFRMPLIHASMVFRRTDGSFFDLRYDTAFKISEDYELLARFSQKYGVANLGEVLYEIREHPERITKNDKLQSAHVHQKVHQKLLENLKIQAEAFQLTLHSGLMHTIPPEPNMKYIKQLFEWLQKLSQANAEHLVYPEPHFTQLLERLWHKHTAGLSRLGLRFGALFARSPFSEYRHYSLWQKAKFWTKCLVHRS
ncbi:MAG: hypothetical protein OHK0053_23870 [Microscillaceae bacterium]